jgi:hypothetical protein
VNIWKAVTFTAVVASVTTVAYRAALAQAGACANQPNMANALSALRSARAYLDHAEHDKGGWRVRAIESTEAAIHETERGCAFADTP